MDRVHSASHINGPHDSVRLNLDSSLVSTNRLAHNCNLCLSKPTYESEKVSQLLTLSWENSACVWKGKSMGVDIHDGYLSLVIVSNSSLIVLKIALK